MSNSIFEGWIYDHDQYKAAFEALVEEIERALSGGSPFVFPVLGDSRSGKSALLKDVATHFAGRLSASKHKQVLFVPMPTSASNEALAARIIQAIIGDIPIRGKTYQILDQARSVLKGSGTTVILVDETNHLVEKRSGERAQTKENRQTADWFKELGDVAGISVVLAGLSHVCRMYADNDQLENRGLTGANIRPYAWGVKEDQEQFQNAMLAGIAHLEENGWKIVVPHDTLIHVTYYGSGGYIGKARDFLARIEAIGRKHKRLDKTLLARAYEEKYRIDSHGNPVDFKSFDTVLLQKAHQQAIARARVSGGRGR